MKRFSRTRSGRGRVIIAALAALIVAAVVPTLATGATSGTTPPPGATVDVLNITGGFSKGNPLKFVNPPSVHTGDYLEIKNETNPKQVGPHTFSLVNKNLVPKTKNARKKCFTKGHICKSLVKAFGKGTVSEGGQPGWDTEATKTTTGDGWFTGTKKAGTTFTQVVSAAPGTTLSYFCLVHTFMHGKLTVLAPGT